MLSQDLTAMAAAFRDWSRSGGITMHPAGCDTVAAVFDDLAAQARALEGAPAGAAAPGLCAGVFADLLCARARRRHADGTVVLLRRVPAIPPLPDGGDAV
jgi:hypothetical protein